MRGGGGGGGEEGIPASAHLGFPPILRLIKYVQRFCEHIYSWGEQTIHCESPGWQTISKAEKLSSGTISPFSVKKLASCLQRPPMGSLRLQAFTRFPDRWDSRGQDTYGNQMGPQSRGWSCPEQTAHQSKTIFLLLKSNQSEKLNLALVVQRD